MNIWRLQTNTSKADVSEYCINNHIIAMGWSLLDYKYPNELVFCNYDDYYDVACDYYDSVENVNRLANYLCENDIIWLRCEGIYYCARITKDSKWIFNNSEEARERDACNQVTNINWIKIGDETVPGALSTAFIRGKVLQRISKSGINEFSKIMYNNFTKDDYRYNINISLTKDVFYNLISPSDCEDLVYMWLYKTHHHNYVCIPSTNKIATEKYEFVIMDILTGKHIYLQVKKGNVDLDTEDYRSLVDNSDNEVYLFTSEGTILNEGKYEGIYSINPDELFEFACDEKNERYIPPNVEFWMQFAGANIIEGVKGIMIDTNNQNCEDYMLSHSAIAAWGSPKKYIKSFAKGDYALFYKKSGFGVIAVGKIVSDQPDEIENGLQHNIEMIVDAVNKNGKYASVTPKRLKKLLNKRFFFASTRKVPFLNNEEVQIIINELQKNQEAL